MANIKKQIKRNITNEKTRVHNVDIKSRVRTSIKDVRVACQAGNKEEAQKALVFACKLIDKSVSSGVQKENTAARQKSEISHLVAKLK